MGWERRKRGGRYYTRSRKVNGRVVREYVGCGDFAKAVAALDDLGRLERMAKADDLRSENERLDAADEAVAGLCETAELLAQAALVSAGYHRHHRGEWRRKRAPRTDAED